MILTCPSCQARYVVPDSAIGASGRKVRCAACRHSWFQEGPGTATAAASATNPAPAPPPMMEAPAFAAPASRPPMVERPPIVDRRAPAQAEPPSWDRPPPALEEPPFRPRRNPARMWTLAALAAGLVATIAALAVYFAGLPNWAMIPVQTGDALTFADQNVSTNRLERGNAVLEVSGTIVNQTDQVQRVPQILAELKDAQGRVIYSWSIAPPIAELQPRGRVAFNSANVGVPRGGRQLSLTFGAIS